MSHFVPSWPPLRSGETGGSERGGGSPKERERRAVGVTEPDVDAEGDVGGKSERLEEVDSGGGSDGDRNGDRCRLYGELFEAERRVRERRGLCVGEKWVEGSALVAIGEEKEFSKLLPNDGR